MRIFVVCGAGASSTFLAHWIRVIAARGTEEITVAPATVLDVSQRIAAGDVVLVGHHLDSHFDAIASATRASGAASALLPPLDFDATGAATALEIARSALIHDADSRRANPHKTPDNHHETLEPRHESLEHHREPENIHG